MNDAALDDPSKPASFLQDYIIPFFATKFFERFAVLPEHLERSAAPENAFRGEISGTRHLGKASYESRQAMVIAETISDEKD